MSRQAPWTVGGLHSLLNKVWQGYAAALVHEPEPEYDLRVRALREDDRILGGLEGEFSSLREARGGDGERRVTSRVAGAFARLVARFYALNVCLGLRSLHEEFVERAALLVKPSQSRVRVFWLGLVADSLLIPLEEFFWVLMLVILRFGSWWDRESYEKGLDRLAALLQAAITLDQELQSASASNIWTRYRRYFINARFDLRKRYGAYWWSILADGSASCAPYLTNVYVEMSDEAATLRLNEERVLAISKEYDGIAERYGFDEDLAAVYDYSVHKTDVRHRNVQIKNIYKGIKSLWTLGTLLYPGLFRYEEVGRELALRVLPPVGGEWSTTMLSVYSLPVSRQIIRIYMQTGSVVEELARREGRRAGDPLLTAASLFNRDWGAETYDALVTHPKPPENLGVIDPPPSIYDQMFRTPVMLAGILHSLLSGVSRILRLEPPIHPDPIRFLESRDALLERLPPETERLLRSSAALPVPYANHWHSHLLLSLWYSQGE